MMSSRLIGAMPRKDSDAMHQNRREGIRDRWSTSFRRSEEFQRSFIPPYRPLPVCERFGRVEWTRVMRKSVAYRYADPPNPSTTEMTEESCARPTLHAAFLPLDQSVLYSNESMVCPAAPCQKGTIAKGSSPKGCLAWASVQSGETLCARRGQTSQEPPIAQVPQSPLLRLARTVQLRQDRPRKITWRRHWRPVQ